jgi:L-asparagine transporter-like permease
MDLVRGIIIILTPPSFSSLHRIYGEIEYYFAMIKILIVIVFIIIGKQGIVESTG